MITVSDVTKAVETAFNNDPLFTTFTIERSEFVNENPSLCPWLGIYRGDITYDPETLGLGDDAWEGRMVLRLVAQATNFNSGAEAEDQLEDYVNKIITKMLGDTTLAGTIDMITGIKVSYSYIAEEEETIYFQAAIIELTLEVSTS